MLKQFFLSYVPKEYLLSDLLELKFSKRTCGDLAQRIGSYRPDREISGSIPTQDTKNFRKPLSFDRHDSKLKVTVMIVTRLFDHHRIKKMLSYVSSKTDFDANYKSLI